MAGNTAGRSKGILAVLLVGLSVILVISVSVAVGSVHQTIIAQSHQYEEQELLSRDERYLLRTQLAVLDTGAHATFSIVDLRLQEIVYSCPDAYRTRDLKSIGWADDGSCDVIVRSGDVGTVHYHYETETWRKQR